MSKRKLRIFMHGDNTGVSYYRINNPAHWIKKLDLAEVRTTEYRWGEESEKFHWPTHEELCDIGHWADIIVFLRSDKAENIATFCGMGELFNMPIVLETDDDITAVRPYNPGYRGYHPNSEALLWGKLVPKKVDAITVTTNRLKELHKTDCKEIYILPNSLDLKWRDSFKRREHKDGKIHLGWFGSGTHFENLKMIEQPVAEIIKKYSNVMFHCMGMYGNSLWNNLKKDQIKKWDWSTLRKYPKMLAEMNLDIGLAPAMDNNFHRAKSNLRYLEMGATETAVIASPTECYKGIKGLYAKEKHEWFEQMEKLILDEKLRKKLGAEARKDVEKNFDIEKNAIQWVKTYEKIVKNFEKKHGSKRYYYS